MDAHEQIADAESAPGAWRRVVRTHFGAQTWRRWASYAGIGAGIGAISLFGSAIDSDEHWSKISLLIAVNLAVLGFGAAALLFELMRYEVLKVTLTLSLFGGVYFQLFPASWAAGALAVALLLALSIAAVVNRYRSGSWQRFRLLGFRLAVALLLLPVLWFCANVDTCLDRGGVWEWSGLDCRD